MMMRDKPQNCTYYIRREKEKREGETEREINDLEKLDLSSQGEENTKE